MYRFFLFDAVFSLETLRERAKAAERRRGRSGQKTDFLVLRRLVPYLATVGFCCFDFVDWLYLSILFPLLDAVVFAQLVCEKENTFVAVFSWKMCSNASATGSRNRLFAKLFLFDQRHVYIMNFIDSTVGIFQKNTQSRHDFSFRLYFSLFRFQINKTDVFICSDDTETT